MDNTLGILAVGIGATVIMDGWAFFQKRFFNMQSLDYRLVGRWVGYFPKSRFVHDNIGKTAAIPGEKILGWITHYASGIVFAGLLVFIWPDWLLHPTLLPALIVGIGSIVIPFFIMQPGFGIGIAASRTPEPWSSRYRSLVAHGSFAVGLYLSGLLFSLLLI